MKKVLQLISLAQRAGKVSSGEFQTEEAVKTGIASLVIVANDASDNTKKKFTNMCSFYEVPIRMISSKDEFGHCIGKDCRASLSINDDGLATKIISEMTNTN